MEEGEPSRRAVGEEFSSSIPRGGPIFVPDLVSPPSRVPLFEAEVFNVLESLKAEVEEDLLDLEEDISVDELKLRTDEDLVTEAMKIIFEGDQEAPTSSGVTENPCTSRVDELNFRTGEDLVTEAMKIVFEGDQEAPTSSGVTENPCTSSNENKQNTTDPDTAVSCESSASPEASEASDANVKKRKTRAKKKPKSKKKKKSTKIAPKKVKQFDVSYLAKVEHLAKIRQDQEEDKSSVELHSFNRVKKDNAAVSSGKVETLKCVESSTWPRKVKCSRTTRNIPIQYPEVVLCVEVYHHKDTWKKSQEFLVLGRQTLTELRDRIRCLTDVVMQKASEEKDDDHPDIMYDPSGYFLIEELFCNDMRDPNAIDYSEPIFDWLKNSEGEAQAKWDSIQSGVGKVFKMFMSKKSLSKLPNFRAVDMDKIRFCDLGFCLGTGYLYCHQGDCKHIIVIRDMRLIHPDDVQNRAAYPLLIHEAKSVLKKCNVCRIFKATKVTLDDKMARENPCYFCETCYYLLHYSKDGNLLYSNFKVFDYLQDYC